jgi:predicted nucleic acid-binding protein
VEAAAAQGDQIGISAITLAELVYPIEKGRIPAETFTRLMAALDAPDAVLVEIPFDRRIAATLRRVDRLQVPDLPDRLIAATALSLGLPLIGRDGKIRASAITTIW